MVPTFRTVGEVLTTVADAARKALALFDGDSSARAYLDGATDRIDLELRMRELDRPRRSAGVYPTNFSMNLETRHATTLPAASGYDIGFGPARTLANAGDRIGCRDDRRQHRLRIQAMARRVCLEGFQIDPQRRALGAGARQAEDRAGAAIEHHAHALPGADRSVGRVLVGEIVNPGYGQGAEYLAGKRRQAGPERAHQLVAQSAVDRFVD